MAVKLNTSKNKTIFVRNLPFSLTNEELEKFFGRYGTVKRSFIITDKEKKKSKGYGYVTFGSLLDCEKTLSKSLTIEGRQLILNLADSKATDNIKNSSINNNKNKEKTLQSKQNIFPILSKKASDHAIVLENISTSILVESIKPLLGFEKNIRRICTFNNENDRSYNMMVLFKSIKHALFTLKKLSNSNISFGVLKYLQYKNNLKDFQNVKKNRIIIRNLSFKIEEEDLRKLLDKYGKIIEILIPSVNGKKKGFAIVQFMNYEDAQQALQNVNESTINNRPVAVDWLLPKNIYVKSNEMLKSERQNLKETKENDVEKYEEAESEDVSDDNEVESSKDNLKQTGYEKMDVDDDDDEMEDSDDNEMDDDHVASENYKKMNGHKLNKKIKGADELNIKAKGNDNNDHVDDNDDDDDDGDNDDDDNDELMNKKYDKLNLKQRKQMNDAENGRTLFIRNLSFDSTEEDLEEIFEEFGELYYCRIVLDPKTEHSRGMAFIQFKTEEGAENCLKNFEDKGLTVDGRKLVITKALSREKIHQIADKSNKDDKEQGRNLHLIRLSMIRPGTKAAEGLSKADLAKRMKVEVIMREKLKNPNIFVSPTRICVRNLPTSVDDKKLKKIFLEACINKSAKITECRIMRDLNRVNADGIGKSRGYAFLSFSRHEDALSAVQITNNNDQIFGKQKRLIVEFSLENRSALISKERRKEKAKIISNKSNKRLSIKDLTKRVRPNMQTKSTEPKKKKVPTATLR